MDLALEHLRYTIDKKVLLHSFSCTYAQARMHALIGPNGAGKSTLLRSITGIYAQQDDACINVGDNKLHRLRLKERARFIGYMPQFQEIPSLLVKDLLELGWRGGALWNTPFIPLLKRISTRFAIEKMLDTSLVDLSGGERQKVLLASMVMQHPKVLLLDEPISHLDPKNQMEMLSLLKELCREMSLIVLIVLHDVQHALHYCDTVTLLKQGCLVKHASFDAITQEDLGQLYDTQAMLFWEQGHPFVYYKN